MKYPTHPTIRPKRHTASAVLVGLVMFAIQAAYTPPAAHAGDPPDDCWGGALSADPLHCYVLDQAHSTGVIEVDAVYEANGVLYIYLGQTEPLGDEVGAYFKEKSTEFVERWPDRVYRGHQAYSDCAEAQNTTYEDCMLNRWIFWEGSSILPFSTSYTTILLRTGGANALREEPGWAAYHQLWPETATASIKNASGVSRTSGQFDVSGVDTTNILPVDCSERMNAGEDNSCRGSQKFPGLGIVGWRSGWEKEYVEVKSPVGQEANITAAREAIIAYYPDINDTNLVAIPAKYSYEELWRWATIVNRFAITSGNTPGITSADIGVNFSKAVHGQPVHPLESVPEAEAQVWQDYRTTIRISTLNLQPTLDALAQLLGQLGIPVDAVGVVIGQEETAFGIVLPDSDSGFSQQDGGRAAGVTVARRAGEIAVGSQWLIVGTGSVVAAILLGSAVFFMGRMRRRQRGI